MRICIALFAILLLNPAISEAKDPSNLLGSAADYGKRRLDFDTSKYKTQLNAVNAYFRNFTTMQSEFTQTTGADMGISTGMAYIKRPGKSRWEYATPSPALLIINNDNLTFFDIDLNQVTYNEVPQTPLKMILDKDFDLFSEKIRVLDVQDAYNTITLAITSSDNIQGKVLGFGGLVMVFSKNPMQMTRVYATNENNQTTTISFENPRFDTKLDDGLFVFEDTRPKKRRQ